MHSVNCEDFWDINSNFHVIHLYHFFLPLVFLSFLAYPGNKPLADDSQSDSFRAPDEKISLGLKDSSKQGHKTKGNYLFFIHQFRRE